MSRDKCGRTDVRTAVEMHAQQRCKPLYFFETAFESMSINITFLFDMRIIGSFEVFILGHLDKEVC